MEVIENLKIMKFKTIPEMVDEYVKIYNAVE